VVVVALETVQLTLLVQTVVGLAELADLYKEM
jgi:hypothetical protein